MVLGGGVFFHHISSFSQGNSNGRERGDILLPPMPVFSPTDQPGRQTTVERDQNSENEELQSIWENSQSLKDEEINKVSFTKSGRLIYSLTTEGSSANSDNVNWIIHAKRKALTSIALTLIKSCQSEDQAKESFLNGKIELLTFDETKKHMTLIFAPACTLKS